MAISTLVSPRLTSMVTMQGALSCKAVLHPAGLQIASDAMRLLHNKRLHQSIKLRVPDGCRRCQLKAKLASAPPTMATLLRATALFGRKAAAGHADI